MLVDPWRVKHSSICRLYCLPKAKFERETALVRNTEIEERVKHEDEVVSQDSFRLEVFGDSRGTDPVFRDSARSLPHAHGLSGTPSNLEIFGKHDFFLDTKHGRTVCGKHFAEL